MERERAPESIRGMAIGKYHLFASLGRGGMADVYLAVAHGPGGFNKLTVIKRLRPDLSADPTFSGMLLDEARLAARLNHPNIVHTYEVGEADGSYYIAMEYLEGQPLVRVARASSREGLAFEPAFCARIIADALAGLHHAHELHDYDGRPLSIIHRDVSPHNIFITYDGMVKLMDFGIAKAASRSSHTEIGVLKGKVAYMAPEQARAETIDRRADLFSMGVVLWELLTRQRLFHAGTTGATLHRLLLEPIPRVSERVQSIDPRLDDIVARALAKEPVDRFQTALEMRNELESWWVAASGASASQEEIGVRTSEMFEETHQRVHRQIQLYMADPRPAESTGELVALNAGALGSFDSGGTPSGRKLAMIGSHTGNGSSSDLVPMASPGSVRGPLVKARTSLALLAITGASALVLALAAAGLFTVRTSRTPGSAVPTASAESRAVGPGPTANRDTSPTTDSNPAAAAPALAPPLASVLAAAPTSPVPDRSPRRSASAHGGGAASVARATTASSGRVPDSAAESGTGYLTFDTYPWTRVLENGRLLGTTPLVHLALSSGTHLLTLENPEQGIRQSYAVTLKPEESISRRLGLK